MSGHYKRTQFVKFVCYLTPSDFPLMANSVIPVCNSVPTTIQFKALLEWNMNTAQFTCYTEICFLISLKNFLPEKETFLFVPHIPNSLEFLELVADLTLLLSTSGLYRQLVSFIHSAGMMQEQWEKFPNEVSFLDSTKALEAIDSRETKKMQESLTLCQRFDQNVLHFRG